MADENPPPSSPPPSSQPPGSAEPPTPFNIGEEFGTAKRNLPPATPVLIALGVVVLVVGIYSLIDRARPQGSGQIDNVAGVEVPGQNSMLVAITVTLRNSSKKRLWIHTIQGTLKTAQKEFSDDAASAADFDRYYEAFPPLKQGATAPLMPETKLRPGDQVRGTIVVSFPVTQDVFAQRQSVSVVIQTYDEPVAVVLTK